VEAVGVEPTSGERVPRASTRVAFVSGHRPCAVGEGPRRRRQLRFDDPAAVRSQPRRSVHFSDALARAVDEGPWPERGGQSSRQGEVVVGSCEVPFYER